MKKKIAIDLQPCCGNRSGVGNVAYELACRLHDTDDIQFHGNVFNFMGRNDNSESLRGINMPVKECKLFPYWAYRRIWNVVPINYDLMFGKADISLFFNFAMPPHISGKSLVYIHDMTFVRYPETMSKQNYEFITKSVEYSIKHADTILTNSEFSKHEIAELTGMSDNKISVIYPSLSLANERNTDTDQHSKGIDSCTSTEQQALSELFAKHDITNGTRYLLFVSSIEPRKNIKRLLIAFDKFKNQYGTEHKLVLAGGSGWKNEEIYKTAESLQNREDVIFTGFVTGEEKNALYRCADAFIYPSIYEGFGMPPLEAMHMGCPVITSKIASLPEVCGDAAEYVDPYDIDSIADGIAKVVNNKSNRDMLITNGYENILKFSWDESAEKLMTVCKSCL